LYLDELNDDDDEIIAPCPTRNYSESEWK